MLPELWNDLRYRIRAFIRRDHAERHLDLEIEAHLARTAEQYERHGLSPAEARRQARLVFGGIEGIKEQSRDVRGTAFIESSGPGHPIRGSWPCRASGVRAWRSGDTRAGHRRQRRDVRHARSVAV